MFLNYIVFKYGEIYSLLHPYPIPRDIYALILLQYVTRLFVRWLCLGRFSGWNIRNDGKPKTCVTCFRVSFHTISCMCVSV